MLTACKGSSQITTGNEPIENAVYTSDNVSLAAYTGLKAEKKNYIVTEQAVEEKMREELMEFADYKIVDRPSKSGDYVQTNYKASIDGSVVQQEDQYDFVLGAKDLGKEFDDKLTGVSAGDELQFSLDYDSDFMDVEWAGKTVDFEISILSIQEEIMPEPTDAFLSENTSYDSYQAFSDAMREELTDSYAIESTEELQENLIQQVIDASSILQYSKEDYEKAKNAVNNAYLGYLELFGMDDLNDVYEFLDMTDEDVEEEIQSSLYRTLIIHAIIENEHISLSDEEYEEGVLYYMEITESESRDEFMQTFGEDQVRSQLLEDKALNFLVNNADITEIEAEYEAS